VTDEVSSNVLVIAYHNSFWAAVDQVNFKLLPSFKF